MKPCRNLLWCAIAIFIFSNCKKEPPSLEYLIGGWSLFNEKINGFDQQVKTGSIYDARDILFLKDNLITFHLTPTNMTYYQNLGAMSGVYRLDKKKLSILLTDSIHYSRKGPGSSYVRTDFPLQTPISIIWHINDFYIDKEYNVRTLILYEFQQNELYEYKIRQPASH